MKVDQVKEWTIIISSEEAFVLRTALKTYLLDDDKAGLYRNIAEHCEMQLMQCK